MIKRCLIKRKLKQINSKINRKNHPIKKVRKTNDRIKQKAKQTRRPRSTLNLNDKISFIKSNLIKGSFELSSSPGNS